MLLLLPNAITISQTDNQIKHWGNAEYVGYPPEKQKHSTWCVHAALAMGVSPRTQTELATFYVNEYVAKGKYGIKLDCTYPYKDEYTKKMCIDEAGVELGNLESYVSSSKCQFSDFKEGLVSLYGWLWEDSTEKTFPCLAIEFRQDCGHAVFLMYVGAAYYHTENTIWFLSYMDPADAEQHTDVLVDIDDIYIIQ